MLPLVITIPALQLATSTSEPSAALSSTARYSSNASQGLAKTTVGRTVSNSLATKPSQTQAVFASILDPLTLVLPTATSSLEAHLTIGLPDLTSWTFPKTDTSHVSMALQKSASQDRAASTPAPFPLDHVSHKSRKPSSGIIAAITTCSIFLIGVLCMATFVLWRRKSATRESETFDLPDDQASLQEPSSERFGNATKIRNSPPVRVTSLLKLRPLLAASSHYSKDGTVIPSKYAFATPRRSFMSRSSAETQQKKFSLPIRFERATEAELDYRVVSKANMSRHAPNTILSRFSVDSGRAPSVTETTSSDLSDLNVNNLRLHYPRSRADSPVGLPPRPQEVHLGARRFLKALLPHKNPK